MKKIYITFISLTFVMLLACFFTYQSKDASVEMIISVHTEDDAMHLSEMYDIELVEYSPYGYATYEVDSSDVNMYKTLGFEVNQTLITMGSGNPFTEDPFRDDQYALDLMDVTEAWTLTTGSMDVIIAIIDTGIDTDHEEFQGRILQNSYNARTKTTSDTSLSHVEDDNGHGTMVAGIIGANKDNSKGIAGIVQQSKLLVIKANNVDDPFTEDDESEEFLESTIAEAIHYARTNGADIINLSLGTKSTNTVTQNAIQQAIEEGIIIIGASGNDGATNKYYPASYPGVISVGSIDETLTISDFSNYNDAVDLTAPGSAIVSTGLNNGYMSGSGTSFAAPQVAGVVALMKSYYPSLSRDEIINQLTSTAMDRGTSGYDHYYGFGVINAAQAMNVSYVTVTFQTDGGTAIPPMQVVSGFSFTVDDPIKEGHIFIGWYEDSQFLVPFEIGTDTVTVATTLYAKYQKNVYLVALVVDQVLFTTLEVSYGDSLVLPNPEEPFGYDFAGWYYQVSYQDEYLNEPVTSSFTLYAKFEREIFTISYYVNGFIYDTEDYPYESIPEPPTPPSLFTFMGWYYEDTFVTPYDAEPIDSSFSLYARFNDGSYTVTFYDYDHTSILSTSQVYYGFPATPPEDPEKPNSPSFSYAFIGWSEGYQDVKEDLSIYPLYEKTYMKETIKLIAGIDTVSSFDSWVDTGITLIDPLLSMEIQVDEIDDYTYKISYKIFDGEDQIDVRYRMVTVNSYEEVTIELLPGVATIEVGDTYNDAGATSNLGDVEVISSVDTSKPGEYEVQYKVTYQDKTYEKTRFVYVLETDEYHPTLTLYYRKEEGWWNI